MTANGLTTPLPPATGSTRTANVAAAIVLALAVTAIAGLLVFLGERVSRRIDVTSTREHELSPQTRRVLEMLDRTVTLVIAADMRQVDPRARQRLLDVIDKFQAGTKHFEHRVIDTASAGGAAQFDSVMQQLADADRPAIDAASKAVRNSCVFAEEQASSLREVSDALVIVSQAAGEAGGEAARKVWSDRAALCRVDAADLKQAAVESMGALDRPSQGLPTPPLDTASRALRAVFDRSAGNLASLTSMIDAVMAAPATAPGMRARLGPLLSTISPLRDRAARTAAVLERTGKLPLLAVARTIQRTRAILLIDSAPAGPDDARPRVVAIDAEAFLPSDGIRAGLDTRAREEEMIGAAIGAMTSPIRPLVVLVHSVPHRLGPDFNELTEVRTRLSMHGIDLLEWAVAVDRSPPVIPPAPPGAQRPVVYVTIGRDVRSPEDAARLGPFSDAVVGLVASGKPVLMSLNPSTLPGSGAADPMVAMLPSLGLTADTGRPLMEAVRTPNGSVVSPDQFFTDPGCDHPLARAMAGLRTILVWPVPLKFAASPPTGVVAAPLIRLAPSSSVWAESEWQAYRQIPDSQRAMVTNPPAKDSPRDDAGDGNGWTLAAAVERRSTDQGPAQRIVIVGSNGWFLDAVLRLSATVDGKAFALTPGNAELFMASVTWLAGQDDLLLRSATAQGSPTIPGLSAGQLSALRWLLIGGLPAVTLVLGGVFKWLRG